MTPLAPNPFYQTRKRNGVGPQPNGQMVSCTRGGKTPTTVHIPRHSVDSPNIKFTSQLLELDKCHVSIVVGLITGHMRLNKHLNVLGIRDDPDCDRCGGGAGPAIHFLCKCPGYNVLRKSIFGCDHLNERGSVSSNIGRLACFALRSGRFQSLVSHTTASHSSHWSRSRYTGQYPVLPNPLRPQQQTTG